MIEVENLWKLYDSVEAVRDLSFVVEPGEILGLVGPNGAGKTTTMRCLCGIIPPTAGDIQVCGLSMFDSPVDAKRLLAFVPAEPRFFPHLTVWEHLQMFARMYGSGEQLSHAGKLLESLVLQEKRNHFPGALSRGMQQKLMIACALIHKPRALIFDEPFTGLDPLAIRKIREILRKHADEGASVLISSHLLAMVEDMVDRVLIIQKGEKVAHEKLDTLIRHLPDTHKDAGLEEIFLYLTGPDFVHFSRREEKQEEAPIPETSLPETSLPETSSIEESKVTESPSENQVAPEEMPVIEGDSVTASEVEDGVIETNAFADIAALSVNEVEGKTKDKEPPTPTNRWLPSDEEDDA